MKINNMEVFRRKCRACLIEWVNAHRNRTIDIDNTDVVRSCKTLQNCKCLCSTNVEGDTIYAEFTYNGDKQELYCDYYTKEENVVER